MPTIRRLGPYRLFFYTNENNEPAHVHVERDGRDATAKYWIGPVRYERSQRMRRHELAAIEKIVRQWEGEIAKAWRDHFGL